MVSITLEVQACETDPVNAWTNIAEIDSFEDEDGEDRTDDDIDSDADTDPTNDNTCLLYTSPSPRDATLSRMPSSA